MNTEEWYNEIRDQVKWMRNELGEMRALMVLAKVMEDAAYWVEIQEIQELSGEDEDEQQG